MARPSSQDVCPPTEVDSARDDPERLYSKFEAISDDVVKPKTSDEAFREDLSQPFEKLQDILRIIPLNTEAYRAFDSVAQSAKGGSLDPLHAQYLHIIGKRTLGPGLEDAGKDSGETTDEAPYDPPVIVYTGYYRIRFALPAISKGPTWIVGRGSGQRFGSTRNVDILLIAPGTKGSRGLAAAHIYLGVHPESGAWKIAAAAKVQIEDKVFGPGDVAYLYQPTTRIEISNMQYLIKFDISTPDAEQKYVRERNRTLQRGGFAIPCTEISSIPFPSDTVFNTIVFRHGIGSGSFGSVYEGFDPQDGKLRVAKRIIIKSAREAPDVEREIQALERFKGKTGIIELIDWRTALNGKDLSVSRYPLDVYLVHQKGIAFDKYEWDVRSWDLKRSLLCQLLQALAEIHRAGCMHRDITPMNLLIFPYQDPPQATLCDFGKFCQNSTDVDTKLAAWKFLPPELKEGHKNPYNQSLDVWMLGLALMYCWWPQARELHARRSSDYRHMQESLRQSERGDNGILGNLIADMLAWDPRKRPLAADALKHESLQRYTASKEQNIVSFPKRSYDVAD